MMRRTISLLAVLLLGLTACSDGSGSEEPSASVAAEPSGSPTAMVEVPEGTIAFSSTVSGTRDVYVIESDGSGLTRLTEGPRFDEHPAWSPDGMKIAYHSHVGDLWTSAIWVMDPDGSDERRLTKYPIAGAWPSWSPDGTRIAFTNFSSGSGDGLIYVMDADGSDPRQVTTGDGDDLFPTWASDGRIYFLRVPSPDWFGDVFVVDPDGGEPAQLTHTGEMAGVSVANDATELTLFDNACSCLVALPTSGEGEPVSLGDALPYGPILNASWSPDGTVLALANADENAVAGSDLRIMSADGTASVIVPNVEGAFDPVWRPA
jgi:Tol biopolymer transport system component